MEKQKPLYLTLFRAWHYLRHRLTAWNTGGEGIHSPYLFRWVRFSMYDTHAYYAFSPIEKQRIRLLNDKQNICLTDYGTGASRSPQRRVCDIATTSLQKPKYARLLFRLVQFLTSEQDPNRCHPLNIVELGTSLGITTAYLAAPHSQNHVLTYEGSKTLIEKAQSVWKTLQLNNIEVIQGNIDQTLSCSLPNTIDLAYIDANHCYDAAIRYFQTLLPYLSRKSVLVMDDIHYSPGMLKAWLEVCRHPKVTTTMDLYDLGLVFFDPDYLPRNYRLRY